eukprot:29833_1
MMTRKSYGLMASCGESLCLMDRPRFLSKLTWTFLWLRLFVLKSTQALVRSLAQRLFHMRMVC